MTKRKPKSEPIPPAIVFDAPMLERAYQAALKQAEKKSFNAAPREMLRVAIEAALQVNYQADGLTPTRP